VRHVQVPVRVNAWVDSGVAQLVEALTEWDTKIVTLDSCEAGSDALAFVQFTSEPADELLAVTSTLADVLSRMECCPAILTLQWTYGGSVGMAKIACPTPDVPRLAAHVANSCRTSPSVYDSSGTSTHSLTKHLSHQR
jgi:hypothetical protein